MYLLGGCLVTRVCALIIMKTAQELSANSSCDLGFFRWFADFKVIAALKVFQSGLWDDQIYTKL